MEPSAVYVTPFQVGWKVVVPSSTAAAREAVTAERDVAIEWARYYAKRSTRRDVLVCHSDGTVLETIQVAAAG